MNHSMASALGLIYVVSELGLTPDPIGLSGTPRTQVL